MQRLIDHAVRRAERLAGRLALLALGAGLLLPAALPSLASAATQTLTVELAGSGTGTVTSSPAGIECGGVCSAPFTEGSKVILKAIPGPNTKEEVGWTGCPTVNLAEECSVTMSAAKTVTATFDLLERPLTVSWKGTGAGTVTSSPAGIECDEDCSASFVRGTTVTLTGTPETGTLAPSWAGCDSVDAEHRCLVAMSKARAVTVTFDLAEYPLAVKTAGTGTGTVTSSPVGISCPGSCQANFSYGTSVTLGAASGLHTLPVKWLGCDSEPEGECQVTMSGAREVTAVFNLEPQYVPYTITLRPLGTGKGTVTSAPSGIECGETCSAGYIRGTSLTLFATPEAGSEFDHWSVAACGASPLCTTTVKGARKINAVFTAVGQRTLTVAKGGNGAGTVTSKPAAIECGSACSTEIDASKKVVLRAVPAPGSKFAGWSGDCAGRKGCKLRMNEARNVTATFERTSPAPDATGRLKVVSGRVGGRRAQLTVNCFGETACKGTLTLIAKIRGAGGKARGLVIAKLPYSLAAGATQTLSARISRRGIAQLRSHGHLTTRIAGQGVESRTVRLRR